MIVGNFQGGGNPLVPHPLNKSLLTYSFGNKAVVFVLTILNSFRRVAAKRLGYKAAVHHLANSKVRKVKR